METAYKTNPAKLNGISFISEIEAAKLKNQDVDVIIALCHVGIDETKRLNLMVSLKW